MGDRDRKLQWSFPLLLGAAAGAAVMIGSLQHSSAPCAAKVVGTNVTGVVVRVTHAPNHTFYYPSRLRWEWDRIRQRLGLPVKNGSQVLSATSVAGSDMLWVELCYRHELPVLSLLTAEETGKGGGIYSRKSLGGLLDDQRRVSVTKWPLVGGLEHYRGKTIHIRTMAHGKELAAIEFR